MPGKKSSPFGMDLQRDPGAAVGFVLGFLTGMIVLGSVAYFAGQLTDVFFSLAGF